MFNRLWGSLITDSSVGLFKTLPNQYLICEHSVTPAYI